MRHKVLKIMQNTEMLETKIAEMQNDSFMDDPDDAYWEIEKMAQLAKDTILLMENENKFFIKENLRRMKKIFRQLRINQQRLL